MIAFFILNDAKSFMEPQYSVTQSSAMKHPYKWAIADVLPGKISLVQRALVITYSEEATRLI